MQRLKITLERRKYLAILYPENEKIRKQYYECKEKLTNAQINQIKYKIIHEKAYDMMYGDMPTKSFFEKTKQ